jgi:hypothetical protein
MPEGRNNLSQRRGLERRAINLHHSLFVILNLFQDNRRRSCVILKQVQDDDDLGFLLHALGSEALRTLRHFAVFG